MCGIAQSSLRIAFQSRAENLRCPRQRSSTVSVLPTHLPDTAAEGHGPSSGFSMPPQRRTYSKSFKAQVIQECSEPGASIANIALGYSLNANLVHKWIRLHTQKTTAIQPAFIPLPSQMLGAGSHAQVRCCRFNWSTQQLCENMGLRRFLNETNIYSRGKSLCF